MVQHYFGNIQERELQFSH